MNDWSINENVRERWGYFEEVISREEEDFPIAVYRPTTIRDPIDRSRREILAFQLSGTASWVIPEKQYQFLVDGRYQFTEGIFLIKKNLRIEMNDLILRTQEQRLYRVIGRSDFNSHWEIHCTTPEMPPNFLIEVPNLGTAFNATIATQATGGLAFTASVE